MYSPSIQKLIDLFSKFPTVGPRTAARFVFYLMGVKKEGVNELLNSIIELKKNIKTCPFCFKPFESKGESNFCEICSNRARDTSLLCIIANEIDLNTIEKIKKYNGRYFILGGTISKIKKSDNEKTRIEKLKERVQKHQEIKEIILAINPTSEGESTTLYLERLLKPFGRKISRLGRGLPVGAELEYADEETLSSALEGRK